MATEKKKGRLVSRLRNKYRLVILNDDTFEEKVSLKLSPLNVFVFAGTIILTLITLVIYLIAFTPMREYVPGYADVNMQRNVYRLSFLADSLEKEMEFKDKFIDNMKSIIDGTIEEKDTLGKKPKLSEKTETPKTLPHSSDDSALRAMIESEDRFDLMQQERKPQKNSGINSFFFFTPVKGIVTNIFNTKEKHYGVDVAAAPNEAIKATLDGTVVLATWTTETGYVIGIQHNNNLFSLYKHNSALLKKAGTSVKAGEAIAIIGNSGEMSTGPHLHFELWYNGSPVNPKDYISF